MMNISKILLILIFSIFVSFSIFAFGFAMQRSQNLLSQERIISLSINKEDPLNIYVASEDTVYKTEDRGKNWQKIYHTSTANKEINQLLFDSQNKILYLCTEDGLYQSQDAGKNWQRVFRGSSDLENDCLCLAISSNALYLGTTGGLFLSYDSGKNWLKSLRDFSESIVSSLVVDPQNPNIVYLACEKGVYISEDAGKSWKRIYVVYASEMPEEDYDDSDEEVSDKDIAISDMVISSKEPSKLYIATAKGIYFTDNKVKSWQKLTNFGLSSLKINVLAVSEDNNQLFAATDNEIYRFNNDIWQKINVDSSFDEISDIEINEKNNSILVGAEGGVFSVEILGKADYSNKTTTLRGDKVIDLDNLLTGEPSLEEIRKVVIKYADVDIEKINNWQRQSRLKALLPTFNVDYDKNVYGSSSGANSIGPRGWGMGFSWDVSDLIWSSDQTSIDVRSRLTVQLRQDILEQVTHYYYQRQRLKAELLSFQFADEKEKFYKELELQEVTANLDALTNGYFSKTLQTEK